MAQTRPQKTLRMVAGAVPVRTSVAKASGDSFNESKVYRNKKKNKIPKSVRYDLENALLGLCDVWFEEIKPHLVRNNIKVHADGVSGAPDGDHERLPPTAAGCSHLDPGAEDNRELALLRRYSRNTDQSVQEQLCLPTDFSKRGCTVASEANLELRQHQNANYVGCYATPQIASRARCHKPPVPLSSLLLSPHHRHPETQKQNQRHKCDERSSFNHRAYQCTAQWSPQSSWLVPRMCRTYSTLAPVVTSRSQKRRIRTAIHPETSSRHQDFLPFMRPKRKCKLKNNWTQTDPLPTHGHNLQTIEQRERLSPCQHRVPPLTSAPFRRCPATTKFFHPRRHKQDGFPITKNSTFILNNPINVLSEQNNDKSLKVLYRSPNREEHSSVMNLLYTDSSHKKVISHLRKVQPWK